MTTWAGIRQAAGGKGAETTAVLPVPTPENATPYLGCGANRAYANVCDWLDVNCGDNHNMWFVPGKCENGHRIAKVIACGKEWCPRCGIKGSIAHNRRIVRWLPKIQQFKRMRYMVFTIPESIRADFRSSGALRQLGRDIQELLKRHGFKRGLRRWHWFGDKSTKWHPHLNVLVEGGYMNGATLQGIKDGYKAIIEKHVGHPVDKVNMKAVYKAKRGDMVGCLSYVTRATFKDYAWDIEMALELRGFRNMVVWGGKLWTGDAAWQLREAKERIDEETGERIDVEAINKIVEHECHICGSHITWDGVLPCRLLDTMITESLGAGYYRILDRKPPPLEDTIRTRCQYEENKHGDDNGVALHHFKKAIGNANDIEEIRWLRDQERRNTAEAKRYSENLAWLEVAAQGDSPILTPEMTKEEFWTWIKERGLPEPAQNLPGEAG